jgi:hypothetical protein
MAVYEVESWGGLVEASKSASRDDTILLTKDIDCNNEIPLGVEETVKLDYVILDGQGHTIRNLRTHVDNPVTIFRGGRMYLKNIDFINLIIYDVPLMENDGYANFITMDHCRCVGIRNRELIAYNNTAAIEYYCYVMYSFFNVPCVGNYNDLFSGTNRKLLLSWCWVRDTYNSKDINNAIGQHARITGSYFDGDLILSPEQTDIFIGYEDYTPPVQNVYDFSIRATTDVSSKSYRFKFNAGVVKNQVRSMDGSSIYTPEIIPSEGLILATPDEMKNPQALYDKGFDIVVP